MLTVSRVRGHKTKEMERVGKHDTDKSAGYVIEDRRGPRGNSEVMPIAHNK